MRFLRDLARLWKEDALADTAAALTYFGVLALFPFLLFLVALASLVLDPSLTNAAVDQVSRFAPGAATEIVRNRLTSLMQNKSGGLLSIGIVAAVWSVSGAVSSLMLALDRCYDVRETRPFWKTRGLAILVTFAVGLMSILACLIMFAVPAVAHFVGGPIGTAITWLRLPLAGVIAMLLWSFLYWVLPNVRPKFQLVSAGSAIGVIVWVAASWGFSQYVAHSKSYDATYGVLGGIIILLVWMWISSAVVLLGAEINKLLTPAEKLKRSATGESRAGREPAPIAHPHQPDLA